MLRIEYFDKNRFMKQVAASRGSVILHLDNGSTCDLKKDDEASAIFQTMDAPKKGFSISVSDPADVIIGDEPHLVDEWQEVPEVWDAARRRVDEAGNRRVGISDPYGGDIEVYRHCRDEIVNSVKEILKAYEN